MEEPDECLQKKGTERYNLVGFEEGGRKWVMS